MKNIAYKILSIFFFFLFFAGLFSIVLAIYRGDAKAFKELFFLLMNFSVAMKYPSAFAGLIVEVLVQVVILWFFYFIGKKFWTGSLAANNNGSN